MLKTFFSLLLAFVITVPTATIAQQATVYKILDGDTIRVILNGEKQYIRLACIDANEVAHTKLKAASLLPSTIQQYYYGNLAKLYLQNRLPLNSLININLINKDKYGRLVAEVYDTNKVSLQQDLLLNGLARVYPAYYKQCSDPNLLIKLEQSAKDNKLGIWNTKQEVVPGWIFRKQ